MDRPRRAFVLPGAIVVAGAFVGLGVYFGLAQRASPTAAVAPVVPQVPVTAAAPTQRPPAATRPAPDPAALQQQVRTAAQAAVARARPRMVAECWTPSAAKNSEPTAVNLGLSLAYRKDGTLTGSGVIEDRAAARPDMFDCIAAIAHTLSIPPPGANVSVEVHFTLP